MGQQPSYLVLPGYQNSDPEHWQSLWEREDPAFRRLQQEDWEHPDPDAWTDTLHRAVTGHRGPLVLVAHSLGCTTIARWAARLADRTADRAPDAGPTPVVAALLVAPPDIDRAEVPELSGFRPVELAPLPFPSVVVAASDDPWCSPERSRQFADSWGSRYVGLGPYGHLNAASGLGSWPEGRALLDELTGRTTG
ncbi:RBBP9/YdeN family alpha/beta hydrolase [Kitasatospora sp. NPDC057015]|uniref:RBBP9/YdeN family alpha/beta hydrolase n=1 Tax=Kitasatospora sp. NPDC057015 TaxID=3346001 RepID=UPI0036255975